MEKKGAANTQNKQMGKGGGQQMGKGGGQRNKMWRMKLWEDIGFLYESGLRLGSCWRKSSPASPWMRAANPWVTAPGTGQGPGELRDAGC